jgi:alginate O-acetyltransferase complex protein AlgI
VWGGIHGALLIAERMAGKRNLLGPLPRGVRVGFTFCLVTVAWVFFRSPTLTWALQYCGAMFGLTDVATQATLVRGVVYQPYYLATFFACAGATWLSPQTWDFTRVLPAWKIAWAAAVLWLAMLILTTQSYNPFIYFIF